MLAPRCDVVIYKSNLGKSNYWKESSDTDEWLHTIHVDNYALAGSDIGQILELVQMFREKGIFLEKIPLEK